MKIYGNTTYITNASKYQQTSQNILCSCQQARPRVCEKHDLWWWGKTLFVFRHELSTHGSCFEIGLRITRTRSRNHRQTHYAKRQVAPSVDRAAHAEATPRLYPKTMQWPVVPLPQKKRAGAQRKGRLKGAIKHRHHHPTKATDCINNRPLRRLEHNKPNVISTKRK